MFSVDLSTRDWDGHVVVALRWAHTIVQSGTPSSGAEHGSPRQQTRGRSVTPDSRTAEPMTVKDGPALQSAARNMPRRDPATVVLFPGCGDDG